MDIQRILITIGVVALAAGLLWPWIARIGLGRLPGDIIIERDGFTFYFPITTCIVVSLVITAAVWLFRR